jgi:hypothetical protein
MPTVISQQGDGIRLITAGAGAVTAVALPTDGAGKTASFCYVSVMWNQGAAITETGVYVAVGAAGVAAVVDDDLYLAPGTGVTLNVAGQSHVSIIREGGTNVAVNVVPIA